MENRRLKLSDVSGYFPYGLKFLYTKNAGIINEGIYGFETVKKTKMGSAYRLSKTRFINSSGFDSLKIILRPLSDLYKTITHNGKEIVPIVELAKIAQPDIEWYFDHNRAYFDGGYKELVYDPTNCCFRQWCYGLEKHTHKQYQLFDYLHELKVDYRGLIDAGLAVDCNTLDVNSYK